MLNFALSIGSDATVWSALAGVAVGVAIYGRQIVRLVRESRKAWLWQMWVSK